MTTLARGVAAHRTGRLRRAEKLYTQVLDREPRHADALHLLGLLSSDAGRHDSAVQLILRAIEIRGPEALYYANLGIALERAQQFREAALAYRRAISICPSEPATPARLARLLASTGQMKEAQEVFEKALGLDPSNAGLHFDFANVLHSLGSYSAAASAYEAAIRLAPGHAEALYNLGVTRTLERRYEDAVAAYRRAIEVRPSYDEAHNNLGRLLHTLGRPREAVSHFQVSQSPEGRYNAALILQDSGYLTEAEAAYREVLRHKPAFAEAHNNLGNVLSELGRFDEAREQYQSALRASPALADAHFNLALEEMARGNFEAGWEGYEWRFRRPGAVVPKLDAPCWDGSALKNHRILLYAEQGLGDAIQFARYVPMVRAMGGRVTVCCRAPLMQLFRTLDGVEQVVEQGASLPAFDCHAPLTSLPRLLATRVSSIPCSVPYLRADDRRVRYWRHILSRYPRPWVGACWSGSPTLQTNRLRSIPEEARAALGPFSLLSLQKGMPGALEDGSTTFDDLAAIVANLDLVISVDTSIVHLAGALGRPVWTLLRRTADWRWLRDREDSPWYPGMRLFRQTAPGDWEPVIAKVAAELRNFGA